MLFWTPPGRLLRSFLAANRRICNRLERWLPQARTSPFGSYLEAIDAVVTHQTHNVLDLGAGKRSDHLTHFHNGRPRLIGLDLSESALRLNQALDGKVAANLSAALPFRDSSIDLLTSRCVIEHVEDPAILLKTSHDTLKSGGYLVHVFSCRFAPFALINQILPHGISQSLLYALKPEDKELGGLPAHYRRCYYTAFRRLLAKQGFEVVCLRPFYCQTAYYKFFLPLFALMALYELVIFSLGLKNLASYLLVVAAKKPTPMAEKQTAMI